MNRWLSLLATTTACVASTGETTPLVSEDLETFAALAQPVFETRCANPSCHGNADRPLSLYAARRYRRVEARTFLDEPVSDDELLHNLLQASVFVDGLERASDSMLLTKPLGVHAGLEVFATDDYDYRRLEAWVETALLAEEGSP